MAFYWMATGRVTARRVGGWMVIGVACLAALGACDGVARAPSDTAGPADVADVGSGDAVVDTVAGDADAPEIGSREEYTLEQVSAGRYHSCAIHAAGLGEGWGLGEDRRKVEPDNLEFEADRDQASFPIGPTFTDVSSGGLHTCALTYARELRCWGAGSRIENHYGGVLRAWNQSIPPEGEYVDVSAGWIHSCAVAASTGVINCWGIGHDPDVDEDYYHHIDSDQAVAPPGVYVQVSAGGLHTCAVAEDGELRCWGRGSDPDRNEDEYGRRIDFDQAVPPSGTFETVSAGHLHTCAIATDETLECWGLGSDPTTREADGDLDQAVPPSGHYRAVSAGMYHTCALATDGTIDCWGAGSDPEDPARRPFYRQAVAPPGTYIDVSAGGRHSCAIATSGAVECWGAGSDGDRARKFDYGQANPPSALTE